MSDTLCYIVFCLLLLSYTHTANAGVLGVSGSVQLTDSPYPVESDDFIFVFNERSGVAFDASQNLNFGSISPGTLVNSHYVQFDPIVPDGSIGTGAIHFDAPILGLITTTGALTDNLGANGTSDEYFGLATTLGPYPTGAPGTAQNRGLGSAQDVLVINIGSPILTINSLDIGEGGSIDAFRVLTAIALAGDLDGDGFVGITDLNLVLGNWNQDVTPGDLLAGDPTGDGFVGIGDLNTVLGNWNAGTPPGDQTSVPEPGMFTALFSAAAVLFSTRGRRLR